ncbi:hypothetical protein Slin15195_G127330 [Septoria linicola]|uniref:Uncharacterized protein n=1 Tax=Septoria linicola TaxID=215465 RepID=A0A9Q9ER17_9PEZI|nr:hypothetical protein Slin14017_G083510 [Septoria linicola]USW59414.1 hypothetical protein Slin15195_G127330 [Septoria linicola]
MQSTRIKATVGEAGEEQPWWLWSVYIISKLARLAKLTKGKLGDAQGLLLQEVRKRQRDQTSRDRSNAEILPQDLDKVNNALIKKYIEENGLDDPLIHIKREEPQFEHEAPKGEHTVYDTESDDGEVEQTKRPRQSKKPEPGDEDKALQDALQSMPDVVKVKHEVVTDDEEPNAPVCTASATAHAIVNPKSTKQKVQATPCATPHAAPGRAHPKREIISDHEAPTVPTCAAPVALQPAKRQKTRQAGRDRDAMAGVAGLRAKAQRHKQEAARLKAEAFELEARVLGGRIT